MSKARREFTDDGTRKFANRFAAQMNGRRPTANQAGVYAGTLHYLRAVATANSTDATVVVPKMKEMPSNDSLFSEGPRAAGRLPHPQHVPVPGEDAGGVERAVGLLQAHSDDPGC